VALFTALDVGDSPGVWESLGFAVQDGSTWVDGIAHRLGAGPDGLSGWELCGLWSGARRRLPPASGTATASSASTTSS
jgi:hypothetical protein